MTSNDLSEIDVSGSILFLGSGFSKDATNIRGQNLPTGHGLKSEFAKILGVDSESYDLRTLADEINARADFSLYQTLYELFTVKKIQIQQRDILQLPWRRIYTTNYDDAAEFARHEGAKKVPSFNYDDEKPKKLPKGSVIHLHGVIRSATEENVLDQLVLNESSYIRQHFEKSTWYDDFIRDLRFCSTCFFVGYSLADYHIAALLMQAPDLREKTYFVTRKTYDDIFFNRVAPYGTILPIETEGFAELCRTLPKPAPVSDPHLLKAFRYLDPFRDKRTLAPPTPIEILNLVTYGTFNFQRCLSTLPGAEYVVPRQKLAEQAANLLKTAKCLLVHSRLGNGKSIFLHILAHKLSEQGYQCFRCVPDPVLLQRDIDLLQEQKKPAILFDSYNSAIDLIGQLTELPASTKFIVAVRTGVQDVRLHEIQSRLPAPLQRVDLNGLQEDDSEDFKRLLNGCGVRAQDLEEVIDQCKDFREIVVSLYDHRQISDKIKTDLMPLLQSSNIKKIFIVSHLLKWLGQDVDPAFLRSVTSRDAYAEIASVRETAGDVFRLDDENVQVRSAMFSEYIIQNHLTTSDIVDCVYEIIVEAVKRKAERRYQAILSSLMRFSVLNRALANDPHRLISLTNLFDRLHRDIDVNNEPLFWLQYSILMTDADDLQAAEGFIRTAYDRAAASPGFQTFQIDTYALRIILLIEQSAVDVPEVARFDEIVEKLERIRSMIGDESRRDHAIQVLEGIEPFVSARISSLSKGEMTALVYQFALLIEVMEGLAPEVRAQTGSDLARNSVLRAKQRLLAYKKPD